MKVCVAQINLTVGDFEGNAKKAICCIEKARSNGAALIVFPELCTTGYPPLDLLENSAFVEGNLRCRNEIIEATDNITAIIGFAEPNSSNQGKPLYNSAVVAQNRNILGIHRKILLPTYDVFDESRYFEPGVKPAKIKGRHSIGVLICEDMWNDKSVWPRAPYRNNPVEGLLLNQPDVIVNLSASPFVVGKIADRIAIGKGIALRSACPFIYCNLVGGNDGLIFDGASFILSSDGVVRVMGKQFEEDLLFYDIGSDPPPITYVRDDGKELMLALCLGIRDYCKKLGFSKVIVGISGGIDSAVVTALSVMALGSEAVVGVTMPSSYTSDETLRDARELAKNLGIKLYEFPIEPMVKTFQELFYHNLHIQIQGVAEENLQARIRALILMGLSNQINGLVLNTGNKSELATGYCTLYGDMIGGLSVIGDLTKDKVYIVAHEINKSRQVIPPSIIERPPSAELRPNQKDEDTLPPYQCLDPIVRLLIEDGLSCEQVAKMGFEKGVIQKVTAMLARSEFKRRQAPPVLKVTKRAFGLGWRHPIVHNFHEDLE